MRTNRQRPDPAGAFAAAVFVLIAVMTIGCNRRSDPPLSDSAWKPPASVNVPNLAAVEPAVRSQLTAQLRTLEQQRLRARSGPEMAEAYGQTGLLLFAAKQYEFAAPFLENAQALVPTDRRWPYYLGHSYRLQGRLPEARERFRRALALAPEDEPTLLWLGEIALIEGQPAQAETFFAAVLSRHRESLAGRFGAGRAALAQHDYRSAATYFESVLASNAKAINVHYPLALAYRGLGDTARARAHLDLRGDYDLSLPDPLVDRLRDLLDGSVSHEVRGARALQAGDVFTAVDEFRRAVMLAPDDLNIRHQLGTALYVSGQTAEATRLFEELVRAYPHLSKSRYSLGVIYASNGKDAAAVAQFEAAIRDDPRFSQAHVQLATAYARLNRTREAIMHYDAALAIDPANVEAAQGRALLRRAR
jgi:protein O-GlcNAc transferase